MPLSSACASLLLSLEDELELTFSHWFDPEWGTKAPVREVFNSADKDKNGVLTEEESILLFKLLGLQCGWPLACCLCQPKRDMSSRNYAEKLISYAMSIMQARPTASGLGAMARDAPFVTSLFRSMCLKAGVFSRQTEKSHWIHENHWLDKKSLKQLVPLGLVKVWRLRREHTVRHTSVHAVVHAAEAVDEGCGTKTAPFLQRPSMRLNCTCYSSAIALGMLDSD